MNAIPIVLLVILLTLLLIVAPGLTMGRDMTGSAVGGLALAVGILATSCAFTGAIVGLLFWAGT